MENRVFTIFAKDHDAIPIFFYFYFFYFFFYFFFIFFVLFFYSSIEKMKKKKKKKRKRKKKSKKKKRGKKKERDLIWHDFSWTHRINTREVRMKFRLKLIIGVSMGWHHVI